MKYRIDRLCHHGALALTALLATGGAVAQNGGAQTPAQTDRALIERIAGEDVTIEERFEGPRGMTGYVLSGTPGRGSEKPVIAWLTQDPRQIVIGNVFDAWGRNLTEVAAQAKGAENPITQLMRSTVEETWARAEKRFSNAESSADARDNPTDRDAPWRPAAEDNEAAPDTKRSGNVPKAQPAASGGDASLSRAERVRRAIEHNRGVIRDAQIIAEAVGGVRALRTFGSVVTEQAARSQTAPRVGIYFDPKCSFCQRFVESLDTERLGDAQVDWIPVGLRDSRKAAERMLADGRPGAASRAADNGPAALDAQAVEITEEVAQGVAANEKVLEQTLIGATPTVVIEYPSPSAERTQASVHVGMSAETLMKTLESNEEQP